MNAGNVWVYRLNVLKARRGFSRGGGGSGPQKGSRLENSLPEGKLPRHAIRRGAASIVKIARGFIARGTNPPDTRGEGGRGQAFSAAAERNLLADEWP